MPLPGEHKTVQSRILEYAEAIGWTIVSRDEAEKRRAGFPTRRLRENGGQECPPSFDAGRNARAPLSLFFDDLLDAKVREFNPRYAEAEGGLLGQFRHLHTDIHGNPPSPKGYGGTSRGKFFDHEEKRERDLILIDYEDPVKNVYEVTEEWAFHNGHYGTREDVVFLINGIPVLVIECKNASKDEAIALGVDQIRRYHRETPELFVSQQLFTATDAIGFSYGVSWNTVRRNIFNWKLTESGFSNPLLGSKGGQECPPSVGAPSFFNPYGQIAKTIHHLPHWQQGEAWVFATWRLGDSLPKAKLDQWKSERDIWMNLHPQPWDDKTEAEYHERFSQQIPVSTSRRVIGVVQPDARFHLADAERNGSNPQQEIPRTVLLDEQHLLMQTEFASEPDAAGQPHLDHVAKGEMQPARQFCRRHPAPLQPLGIAVTARAILKIEFLLRIHWQNPMTMVP